MRKSKTPATNPAPDFLLSSEVCNLLRISKRTLIRWTTRARRPKLAFVRSGRKILYPAADVHRYLAARTVAA